MDLLGLPFLAITVGVSLLAVVAVAVGWDRGPRTLRWPARVLASPWSCRCAALAAVIVNRTFGLYSTLGELLDRPSRLEPVSSFADASDSTQHDPRLVLGAAMLTGGGHPFATWSAALPATIDWVARYLPRTSRRRCGCRRCPERPTGSACAPVSGGG